jgi:hypothetical protein
MQSQILDASKRHSNPDKPLEMHCQQQAHADAEVMLQNSARVTTIFTLESGWLLEPGE